MRRVEENAAMTLTVPDAAPGAIRSEPDPREPRVRLARLLDTDTLTPLHPHDDSGVTAVVGRIDGAEVVAYCTDATQMGGRARSGRVGPHHRRDRHG